MNVATQFFYQFFAFPLFSRFLLLFEVSSKYGLNILHPRS